MKLKRKQQYVGDSDKKLNRKALAVAASPDKLLTLDFDQENILRGRSELTNSKTLWHTGHNFIRVTPAASEITYALISPTRIRIEVEIDPKVIAVREAEDQRQAIKEARTTAELLKWLEDECLFERPELTVFRTPDGRHPSQTAKLEFLSKARKAGLYAGFPTRCEREISTAQFNDWAHEQPEFIAASEKWDRVAKLWEAKIEEPKKEWCVDHEKTPKTFERIITSRGLPEKVQKKLKQLFGDEVPIDAIIDAREIKDEARKEAIAEVYGLIEA
jgi:hypothetical protein